MPKAPAKKIIVVPDIHLPHQDPEAMRCINKVISKVRPDEVVVLGDMLDAEAFSTHPRMAMAEGAGESFYEAEIKPAIKLLDRWQKHGASLVFIEGNHEQRVERFAINMAGAGLSVYDLISPRKLLGRGRQGFKWVPYAKDNLANHHKIAPDLWAIHGWSFAKQAAQVHLDAARSVSVIYGHTHRMQMATTRDPATGRVLKAWSPGTLAKLQPVYMCRGTPTAWTHGFTLIYQSHTKKTDWTEYNITIDRGRCILPGGEEIKA